ncbi:MAG: TIGR03066 family protein, partial [Planctomycetia bacterium]|nr:TIGR03066 family protein [Planctomycetia bacterium]
DKIVRVWDLDTGKELHQFTGHTDSVQGVAISKDGKRVVSGGSDKTVRVWFLPEAGSAPVVPPMNPGPADAKIDPKKLIGKWEPADSAPLVVEFAENGKLIMSIGIGGKSEKVEGTYKLDGDKLELIVSLGGKEEKETGTITKLTDDELILKSTRSGEELKLKKAKPKK